MDSCASRVLDSMDIDGFVRGGILAPVEAATDVARVSKYLFNTKNSKIKIVSHKRPKKN